MKEAGVEVDEVHEVFATKTGVDLESEEDKESGEWKLDRSTMSELGVRDGIAKAGKND